MSEFNPSKRDNDDEYTPCEDAERPICVKVKTQPQPITIEQLGKERRKKIKSFLPKKISISFKRLWHHFKGEADVIPVVCGFGILCVALFFPLLFLCSFLNTLLFGFWKVSVFQWIITTIGFAMTIWYIIKYFFPEWFEG